MHRPSRPDWAGRLSSLRAALATQALEATVVSHASNIRYLTGFAGSSGLLVCTSADAWLVVDGRYEAFVREALQAGELGPVQAERVNRRYDLTLAEVLGRTGAKRVGFEAAHVTVSTLEQWRQAFPGVAWQPTDGLVERQRLIKDEVEQAALRQAAQLLSDVARALGSWVAAGRSERVIAADIDRALVLAGFSGPAFPTIVASGPNSAFPHAQPTERELAAGDLVVLDFGGVLGGYCVDLTRVAAIGQVAREAESLHAAVRDAQAAAFAAVRAGVAAADVDAAARRSLDSRGLAGAFVHGTGHGLGLEVHEAPRIGRADAGSVETLETGMVCTIEPGAYIPGLGGVRLEDDVLVTASGCEVLTDASRDLLIV